MGFYFSVSEEKTSQKSAAFRQLCGRRRTRMAIDRLPSHYWVVLLALISLPTNESINWLAVKDWPLNERQVKSASSTAKSTCWSAVRRNVLTKSQARICIRNPQLMTSVAEASRASRVACRQQFADRRWNCSSVEALPAKSADLTRGTREQSFVYALAAAALVQAVARACATGYLKQCSCGNFPRYPPDGQFKWGGCGDDVAYGQKLTKWFTQDDLSTPKGLANANRKRRKKRKKKRKKKSGQGTKNRLDSVFMPSEWQWSHVVEAVNAHNSRAGRKAAVQSLRTQCKCHGVSGSCSVKTCWRSLPPVVEIANRLKRLYSTAVEVVPRRPNTYGRLTFAVATLMTSGIIGGRVAFNDQDLIYVNKSPDYCTPDSRFGSLGTRGRSCTGHDAGNNETLANCHSMCCGRGYVTTTSTVIERCHCKYHWCCYVRCKTCQKQVQFSKCL